MADFQGTLFKSEITFYKYSGECKCGHEWEYKRSTITLEMFVPCPECGKFIEVGKRFD